MMYTPSPIRSQGSARSPRRRRRGPSDRCLTSGQRDDAPETGQDREHPSQQQPGRAALAGEQSDVDHEIVAAVGHGDGGDGERRRARDLRRRRLRTAAPGLVELLDADRHRQQTEEAHPCRRDGEGGERARHARHGQDRDPQVLAEHHVSCPRRGVREERRQDEEIVDVRGREGDDAQQGRFEQIAHARSRDAEP